MSDVVSGFNKANLLETIDFLRYDRSQNTKKRKHVVKSLNYFEAIMFMSFKNKINNVKKINIEIKYAEILKQYGKINNILKHIIPIFISNHFKILLVDNIIAIKQYKPIKVNIEVDEQKVENKSITLSMNKNLWNIFNQIMHITKINDTNTIVNVILYNIF